MASPTRRTCWPSTPPSRRRAPASTAAASPSSPTRCASWRRRPPRPRARSAASSAPSARRPTRRRPRRRPCAPAPSGCARASTTRAPRASASRPSSRASTAWTASCARSPTPARRRRSRPRPCSTTADAIAAGAATTVGSARRLRGGVGRVEEAADALGAAAVRSVGAGARPRARRPSTRWPPALRPVLGVSRELAGRFVALYAFADATRGGCAATDLCALLPHFERHLRGLPRDDHGRRRDRGGGRALGSRALDGVLHPRRAGPEFLEVELDDRRHPEYYDYVSVEWFARPAETERPWITGPFVDEGGTNAFMVTVSVPALARGRFLGVGATDLRVEQLGALCAPALRRSVRRRRWSTTRAGSSPRATPRALPAGAAAARRRRRLGAGRGRRVRRARRRHGGRAPRDAAVVAGRAAGGRRRAARPERFREPAAPASGGAGRRRVLAT